MKVVVTPHVIPTQQKSQQERVTLEWFHHIQWFDEWCVGLCDLQHGVSYDLNYIHRNLKKKSMQWALKRRLNPFLAHLLVTCAKHVQNLCSAAYEQIDDRPLATPFRNQGTQLRTDPVGLLHRIS